MDILNNFKRDTTMLVNLIYHRGRKDTDWVDYMSVITKDLSTGEKKLTTIGKPEIEIYFTKDEYRDYDYNKSFIEIEKTEKHTVPYSNLEFYIADKAGPEYVAAIKDCIKNRNRSKMKNIHKYRNVFGSDYDIENWYRIWWYLNKDNDKRKPITKQYADIEVDGIDFAGFPKNGECPINAVTIVDEESLSSFTFLLRNPRNPQIQEFEDTIDEFVQELHDDFDDVYGNLDYKIYMYDDERELIKDMFKLIHTLKRDFIMFWNMG